MGMGLSLTNFWVELLRNVPNKNIYSTVYTFCKLRVINWTGTEEDYLWDRLLPHTSQRPIRVHRVGLLQVLSAKQRREGPSLWLPRLYGINSPPRSVWPPPCWLSVRPRRPGYDGEASVSFRGRSLKGKESSLPKGYVGLVLEETNLGPTSEEREVSVKSTFDSLTVWNLERAPSNSDEIVMALDWPAIARGIHGPVTDEE
ncbi:ribonuclease H2 subunit C isoform X1 [Erythrolamprus reginae]|uniref:ribonuclease H2 subunit C isoform X1 n=1 Tax=Erythrolamprus reginae TaxID=121349 RepID=UPI00396C96C3